MASALPARPTPSAAPSDRSRARGGLASGGELVARRRVRALRAAVVLWLLAAAAPLAAEDQGSVPEENRPRKGDAPLPRPESGDLDVRAAALFDAIVHDDPARAQGVFFPREAFLQVKAMADPGRYYDRLSARFAQDIHALHATTKQLQAARFERLDLGRRCAYVPVGGEGNRLPYWACRHARLHYRVGDEARFLEVRVLINWGKTWHVIHLSEFK